MVTEKSTQELRIRRIKEQTSSIDKAVGKRQIRYKEQTEGMETYKINVTDLIFNQYNGRLGTVIKTHEKTRGSIDPQDPQDEKIITDYLWESNINANKATYKDIKEKSQLEPGIITADGVIIDGNRRCMLLKRLAIEQKNTPTYFTCVVLKDTIDSAPKEIRKLETQAQMGEDEKVKYNPMEKHLKTRELIEEDGFSEGEVAKMMGSKVSDVQDSLNIINLLDEYLKYHGYVGMYQIATVQKLEGPLVDLNNYVKRYEKKTRLDMDWEAEKEDISDLKDTYFDYIRAGFLAQSGTRYIGNPKKDNGFFNDKNLFKEFSKRHEETMSTVKEVGLDEMLKERPSDDPVKVIVARDNNYKNQVDDDFNKNLRRTKAKLETINFMDKPFEILEDVDAKLIKMPDDPYFEDDSAALNMIKRIAKRLYLLQKPLEKKVK